MRKYRSRRSLHRCLCPDCRCHPRSSIARTHRDINRLLVVLEECNRRLFVALLVRQEGCGAIRRLARITGLSRNTIRRGIRELSHQGSLHRPSRIRRKGGGCPTVEDRHPGILAALNDLLRDAVAGDPVTGMKWTHKSIRRLSKTLSRQGFHASPNTVARLLRDQGFSLRTCRKQVPETRHGDRDRQFRYINGMRSLYISHDWPVISVDTKKKELIGRFKNPGRCWRRKPYAVYTHDFPSWAKGHAIPYGIYDLTYNDGYVVVGTSHETGSFAGAAIRRWWMAIGRHRYPRTRRLLIEADAGGAANDCRKWAWKQGLQALADEFGLTITVTHCPTGASKWNPIDHRMFSLISGNWAGKPLTSYAVMLNCIRSTRSNTGFHCRARLDNREYPIGRRVTEQEKRWVRLKPRKVFPRWNYTIYPHPRSTKGSNYC
jgi:transposase